jgi:hypothetical protein
MGTKPHRDRKISDVSNRIPAERIHIEKAIFSISSLFIGDYTLDNSINQALEVLGKLVSADRVYIYRLHHKANIFHISHEWLNPDSDLTAAYLRVCRQKISVG